MSVLDYLESHGGQMEITDKSNPDIIRARLGMSKKSFKKALGNLYKKKKVLLEKDKVTLV